MNQNQHPTTSGMSIAALILGILSVLGGVIFTAIPALILGYNARGLIHRSNGAIQGLGMAWTGIIIGWVMIGLSVIVALFLVVFGFFGFHTYSTTMASMTTSGVFITHSLKASSDHFFTEYRKYPIVGTTGSDTRAKSDSALMNTLMASGPGSTSNNPRGIVFFSILPTKPTGATKPGGLVTDPAGNNELLDEWGNHYHIIFDTNGDGQIDDPFTGTAVLESVLIWSDGADGKGGTADDIKTWF